MIHLESLNPHLTTQMTQTTQMILTTTTTMTTTTTTTTMMTILLTARDQGKIVSRPRQSVFACLSPHHGRQLKSKQNATKAIVDWKECDICKGPQDFKELPQDLSNVARELLGSEENWASGIVLSKKCGWELVNEAPTSSTHPDLDPDGAEFTQLKKWWDLKQQPGYYCTSLKASAQFASATSGEHGKQPNLLYFEPSETGLAELCCRIGQDQLSWVKKKYEEAQLQESGRESLSPLEMTKAIRLGYIACQEAVRQIKERSYDCDWDSLSFARAQIRQLRPDFACTVCNKQFHKSCFNHNYRHIQCSFSEKLRYAWSCPTCIQERKDVAIKRKSRNNSKV